MIAEKKHAILSASSSCRWLLCNPSARLEEQYQDEGTKYSKEGDIAHAVADIALQCEFGLIAESTYKKKLTKLKKEELWNDGILLHVEGYRQYARERYNELAASHDGVVLVEIEKQLDYSEYAQEGFGTGDLVFAVDDLIDVTDFKYGRGVYISCVENTQMMLYGLGALHDLGLVFDPKKLRMTVYQPRIDNISTYWMNTGSLKAWGRSIKDDAERAYKGVGPFDPGRHCRFCKVRPCRARTDYNKRMLEYRDAPVLTDDEIREVLNKEGEIKQWLKSLHDEVYDKIYNKQQTFPGYIVTEGRGQRVYTDPKAIEKTLRGEGYKPSQIFKSKELLGITALNGLLGKKQFDELLNEWVEYKPGRLTLKRCDDPAQSVSSADEFDEVIEGIKKVKEAKDE